jgi:hypothetical protein
MKEIVGKDVTERMNTIAKILRITQGKEGEGQFAVAIQLLQPTAAMQTAAGAINRNTTALSTGLTMLLSPLQLGKILKSKEGMDVLLKGMTARPRSTEAVEAITRLGIILGPDVIKRIDEGGSDAKR